MFFKWKIEIVREFVDMVHQLCGVCSNLLSVDPNQWTLFPWRIPAQVLLG